MLKTYLLEQNIEMQPVSLQDQPLDMFGGEFVGQCSPLFRWVGGKTQLLSALKFYSPRKFDDYYEPFIGGGALLFSLMPKRAFINDVNPVLVYLYQDVKFRYLELLSVLHALKKLPDDEIHYLQLRSIFNAYVALKRPCVEMSGLFLYLNAKCFNGLYRVNSKGEFNVGYAKESGVRPLVSDERVQCVHDYFSSNDIMISCGDFLKCTEKAKAGDFVYFDPPYAAVSETKNFTSYSQDKFNVFDQQRLADEFKRLTDKGVKCILSNSDCEEIRTLYSGFKIKTLNVNYLVQPNSDDIRRTECIVLNF